MEAFQLKKNVQNYPQPFSLVVIGDGTTWKAFPTQKSAFIKYNAPRNYWMLLNVNVMMNRKYI